MLDIINNSAQINKDHDLWNAAHWRIKQNMLSLIVNRCDTNLVLQTLLWLEDFQSFLRAVGVLLHILSSAFSPSISSCVPFLEWFSTELNKIGYLTNNKINNQSHGSKTNTIRFYSRRSPLSGPWRPRHPSHQTLPGQPCILRCRSCGVEQSAIWHSNCINTVWCLLLKIGLRIICFCSRIMYSHLNQLNSSGLCCMAPL